jgi:fructose-1,6-bisphosphatase I
MIVYTTGYGVNGFTLNPAIGTFYLSHPNMKFSKMGLSTLLMRNYIHFPQGVKTILSIVNRKKEIGPILLATGSLVSDIHRNMIRRDLYLPNKF